MNILLVSHEFTESFRSFKPEKKFFRKNVSSQRHDKFKSDFINFYKNIIPFLCSICILGILDKELIQYWKLILWTIIRKPYKLLPAITFAIYDYHFRLICERQIQ